MSGATPFVPPRGANGEVLPHDSSNIAPADGLVRFISEQYIVYDPKIGGKRLSTGAFSESADGGMSVELEKKIADAGLTVKDRLSSPLLWAVRLVAGQVRALNCLVGEDPLPATAHLPANPYHGAVWGVTPGVRKKMLKMCAWIERHPEVMG